jgi:hypothetical protein
VLSAPAAVAASPQPTAIRVRVGDHPAFVRAVVDCAHGRFIENQVEAIDPQPFDGTASLRLSHPKVQTRSATRGAQGISVRVVKGVNRLQIDIRAAQRRFKSLSYAVLTSNRLAIDLWRSAPPSPAAEVRRGPGGCLTLHSVRVRAGTVRAAGGEHNVFEHQFRVVLRGSDGRVLARHLTHGSVSWSAKLPYRTTRRQLGTLEGVATSAKDRALVCLVQVRVTLPASTDPAFTGVPRRRLSAFTGSRCRSARSSRAPWPRPRPRAGSPAGRTSPRNGTASGCGFTTNFFESPPCRETLNTSTALLSAFVATISCEPSAQHPMRYGYARGCSASAESTAVSDDSGSACGGVAARNVSPSRPDGDRPARCRPVRRSVRVLPAIRD